MSASPSAPPETTTALPKKGAELDLYVESLAYGGQGVARHDGFVIFLSKGAVPGSRVKAMITKRRKGFAEARVLSELQASPHADAPRCAHFGVCGGCATQNYLYEQQLQQKQTQVADVFRRIGRLDGLDIRPIIGCGETYNYRNKMEFTFSPHAWLVDPHQKEAAPEQVLGLHVPGRFDKVLDIDECHLQHPLGNRVLALVKQLAARYELEPWDVHTHKGFLRHLVVRVAGAASEPQLMVNLVTSREDVKRLKPLVDELVGQVPEVSSLINNINTRKATVAYGEWEVKLHGSPFITAQLRGLRFDISANSFFQTNTAQAGVLYEQIEKAANLDGSEMLFDLYCGTGTIAIDLARQAREVAGFEMVDSAVDDAARNALANEVFNVRFFHADLGDRYFANHGKRLFKQVDKPDVIVSDPPRAGMHPKLVKEVMDLAAKKIVYVSCNPATQARDVALLVEGGYQVKYLQPVDMFPHTPHIENLCVLDRK